MSISENNIQKKQVQQSTQDNIAQIFICSCRKQYNSFPALYLHNKNKHDITLRIKQKDKMKRRVLWSGNKKKLIYQFAQQSSSESDSDETPIKNCNVNIKSQHCKKQYDEFLHKQYRNLIEILNQFTNEIFSSNPTQFHLPNLQNICQQLTNYVLKTDVKFQPGQEFVNLQKQTKTSTLPFYFNGFVLQRLPLITQNKIPLNIILSFLARLSDWMFEKKITLFLAVLEPVTIPPKIQ